MNKEYNLKLDLQFRCNNSKMIFDEFDENTSDFFMQINRQGQLIDISNAIPTLLVLKPGGTAVSQILNVKDNLIYGNLKNSLKNEVGIYIAKLMLVEGNKKTFISNISYEVTENALLGKIDNDIAEDERYSVLIQLLERLSNIELQEQTRIDNENSRVEAENLREESIEKIKNDIANLINETNKKVNDNLNFNTSKIDNLIIDTKEELNKYKENKDKFINEDLEEFKESTTKSIDNYKAFKDVEINNSLNTYKTNTTNDINSFKNTVNSKIDKYKNDKDKAINKYIEDKNLELDNYVEVKSNELDLYVSEKNTLIDSKISEIDNAKTQMQDSINNKLIEVDNAEQIRQQEHEERQQFLDGFEGKLNTVVDDVAGIKDDVVSVREANKRQDIFLQGLYNENLDGRVTVKEEGSVISLTNSDDGLVDIIGLEGNTLVNYCADGVKELTLNGDIEAEGANVTLTDTVDNGLVDVACEGNTLVNLISKEPSYMLEAEKRRSINKNLIKANTVYTVILPNNISESAMLHYAKRESLGSWHSNGNIYFKNGVGNFKTPESMSDCVLSAIKFMNTTTTTLEDLNKCIILEGDYTNKPIPTEYFEGMKSVGECEDNKIEIVSQNKNLFTNVKTGKYYGGDGVLISDPDSSYSEDYIKVKTGEVFIGNHLNSSIQIMEYDINKNLIQRVNQIPTVYIVPNKVKFIRLSFYRLNTILNNEFQFERGNTRTTYVEPKLNKKQITLSEPLRALPNGVKDKKVKIGGKWYVERNCRSIVLDGDNAQFNSLSFDNGVSKFYYLSTDKKTGFNNIICDKLPTLNSYASETSVVNGISGTANNSAVWISLETNATTKEELKDEFNNNPLTLIYELTSSAYEEITDPTLNTYNDITHISNNSTIPCNMKIQNTGYNAIIKPNTQYTVAFDTDKTGEVGINLAGSKVTTNNNVATVTTPSTLTDDSLRLIGKGIKVSKVRLLEGDKTNWIPSYFEGMKSSFEDRLQDDGTYKIEITSANTDNALSNKIQFSSIEPLRGVGDVKDRFVFKDGKLMIERNCGKVIFDVNKLGGEYAGQSKENYICFYSVGIDDLFLQRNLINDKLPSNISYWNYNGEVLTTDSFDGHKRLFGKINVNKLATPNLEGVRLWLSQNPIQVVYKLAEPTYEEVPFELQKIILEGYESGTLFFDTNIPPTATVSYTANIPLVSKVNKVNETTETNTEDIAITQMAVDFLLMSTLGEEMLNFKVRSGYNMASYFASRIIKGALKYEDVINKYPNYKEDIDLILISEGYSDLIVEL